MASKVLDDSRPRLALLIILYLPVIFLSILLIPFYKLPTSLFFVRQIVLLCQFFVFDKMVIPTSSFFQLFPHNRNFWATWSYNHGTMNFPRVVKCLDVVRIIDIYGRITEIVVRVPR